MTIDKEVKEAKKLECILKGVDIVNVILEGLFKTISLLFNTEIEVIVVLVYVIIVDGDTYLR